MNSTHLTRTKSLFACLLVALPAAAQTVSPQLYSDLRYRLIGPFRAGRSVAVSGVPGDGATFYFGSVDGGVWKTTDAGTVWKPIFDSQPVASIGALAVSASNPNVLYAGTGETDIRSDLASGTGVYKSTDSGATWKYIGLKDTRQIAKIAIDPANPDIIYVAALGHAYGPNPERGIYKSTDGGATWKHTLDQGPDVGAADLSIATQKPTILFASMWNAHRPPWSTYAPLAGPGSGIYRSTDGGETWQPCTAHGLPDAPWGRTGVAVSADGLRVYALIEAKKSGLYVSSDGGFNWSLANSDPRLTGRAWYFSRITVDPSDANTIYMPNVALMQSVDGGKTVSVLRGAPGGDDYHELWVDPKNSAHLVLGTDQGTTISLDRGLTWSSWYNQPTAQLYHVTTDDGFPYTVYGAQQDSGAAAVLSRTDHNQITPRDWFPAGGSESGYIAVDPKDPNILYESGSYGAVARWDKQRSLSQDITPWPVPIFGTNIALRKYRDPWTPPLAFSQADKTSLYLGAQYVLKTTDGGLHWTEISPDLTGSTATPAQTQAVAPSGNPSTRPTLGDSQNAPTPDNAITGGYGTLSTVAPSYIDKNVIWTGSDTGILSVTRDGGKTWTNVTPPEMQSPHQSWSRVSLIDPSHFEPAVAYAAVERHRMDDQTPYLYRTRDYGKTWQSITTGLTAPAFVNAVRQDPEQPNLLFAGTEFGLYVSFNNGNQWQPLQLNLPVTSVRDLVIHGDDLVIATHGRSFWILDNITPLRQAAKFAASTAPFLYKPQTTIRIDNDGFPGTPLPPEEPTAENPPNGAILDYYLPADAHSVAIKIFDAHQKLVQQLTSAQEHPSDHASLPIAERWFPKPQQIAATPGMHRIVWNLAWGSSGVADDDEPDDGEGDIPRGPRAAPGTYSVELIVDGKPLPAQPLIVKKDPRSPSTQAEFEKNFEQTYAIFQDSLKCRRALAEIGPVQQQLTKIITTTPQAEIASKAKQLAAAIDALTDNFKGEPLGLEAANQELTSTLSMAESSDRATPSQALVVSGEARAASEHRVQQWTAFKAGPLADFNKQLKAQSLTPIAITQIEHEVYYLMTR